MSVTTVILILYMITGQNLLDKPESVVFDEQNDRYLVSNCGNGHIIQVLTRDKVGPNGEPLPFHSPFNTDFSSVRGIYILDDILYAASDSGLVGIDLETGITLMTIEIPESKFLNDVTADSDGFLYVSDSEYSMIFKVDPMNQTYSILVETGVGKCNGLLYDEKHDRLIVCTGKIWGPIHGVALPDGTVTNIVETKLSYLDGLAFDEHGFIYVSSWMTDSVYRFDPEFKLTPIKVAEGYDGPADICCNEKEGLIVIPVFKENMLAFIKLKPFSANPGN